MRSFILFVTILASTGCIPTPPEFDFETPYSCTVPVIGEVNFDYEPDCDVAVYNFELARQILTTAQVRSGDRAWVTDVQYEQYFTGLPFKITSHKTLMDGTDLIGKWNAVFGIALGNNTKPLVHEMIHEVLYQIAYRTGDHRDWDENGALKAINLYTREYETPDPSGAIPVSRINDVENDE